MKSHKHSPLILVLAASVLLSSAACSAETTPSLGTSVPGNGKWIDSSIRGMVTDESEIRLQDDFAAAANKEYDNSAINCFKFRKYYTWYLHFSFSIRR